MAAILLLAMFFTRGLISLVLLSAGLFVALAALALAIDLRPLLNIDTSVLNFFEPHRTPRRDAAATGGVGVHRYAGLKVVVERTATAGPLLDYSHSFPSGHVTGTGALLGMVAVCLGAGRSSALQARLAVLVVAGVLFVAILALFTGAHTFTDVIGGMLLSGSIVALGAVVLDASTGRRRREAETRPLETARS